MNGKKIPYYVFIKVGQKNETKIGNKEYYIPTTYCKRKRSREKYQYIHR